MLPSLPVSRFPAGVSRVGARDWAVSRPFFKIKKWQKKQKQKLEKVRMAVVFDKKLRLRGF